VLLFLVLWTNVDVIRGQSKLELSSCINAPTSINAGDDYTATFTLRNTSSISWNGQIAVVITGSHSQTILQESNVSISSGQTRSFNTGTDEIALPAGVYKTFVAYTNSTLNGGSAYASPGSCSPIEEYGDGLETHYRGLVVINSQPPELRFTECISAPAAINQGNIYSADFQVQNIGTSTWNGRITAVLANGSATQIVYDKSGLSISGNDTYDINTGNDVVNLNSGVYKLYVAYTNSPTGDSYVKASGCQPEEEVEGISTHCKGLVILSPLPPDLEVDAINFDSPVNQGVPFEVDIRIKNSGGGFGEDFNVGLVLSENSTLDAGDQTLVEVLVPDGMIANSTKNVSTTITLNNSPDNYTLFVVADSDNDIDECNESGSCEENNNLASRILILQIPPPPDFTISNIVVDPNPAGQGTPRTVTYILNNDGGPRQGDISVGFVLSEDGQLSANDDVVGEARILNTDAASISLSHQLDLNFDPDTYTLFVIADSQNEYDEGAGQEENNDQFVPLFITADHALELIDPILINPNPFINENPIEFSATVANNGNLDFSGTIEMYIQDSEGEEIVLDTYDGNIPISETRMLSFSDTLFTSSGGTNFVGIRYMDSGEEGSNLVSGGNQYLNPQDFNVLDPNGSCLIINPDPVQAEAYDAAQYLCGLGIIQQPIGGDLRPDQAILKEDLAKVVFLSLYNSNPNAPTYADHFPVPFGDMQDQDNQAYARYGKVLSYLEYGDGVSPFNRRFYNYRPGSNVTRGQVAKVLVEAFNFRKDNYYVPFNDVPQSHPEFLHIAKLFDLGIISSAQSYFRPDDPTSRIEVFIMLHRLLDRCNECQHVEPVDSDFYDPGNYTPSNLSNHPSLSDANFDQYNKTSFYIPGRNLPLVFEHSYNSYLTDLQDEMFCVFNDQGEWISFQPLGPGWSHSYNAYIQKVPGYNQGGYSRPDTYIISWPNGSKHIYEGHASSLQKVTEGVYDEIQYLSGTDQFEIRKKNQVVYTFSQENSVITNWPYVLTSVRDRNGNEITLDYESYAGGGIRLETVTGTAGRQLQFAYHSGTERIRTVTDPINRVIEFGYGGVDGEDLLWYKDAENYTTNYNYLLEPGKEHLLHRITLPNGNFVDNQYVERKLTSTKTNGASGNITTQSISWGLSGIPRGGTSSTVRSDDGTHEYVYNYESNELGKVTSLATPTNDLDDAQYEDPDNPTLPTKITIDGLVTEYTYDDRGNVLTIDQPMDIKHRFSYNSDNDIRTYTNPRNYNTTFNYLSPGNLRSIVTQIGTTTFDYDSFGLVEKVTNPEGLFTDIIYDVYGNPERISTTEGVSSSSTYDLIGRVETQTNPNGYTSTYSYDNRDFMTSVTNPMSYVTEYVYDGNGNLSEIINAKGNVTHMEYGYFDWMESVQFGDQVKQYDYDEEGKLTEIIKPDGTRLDYDYDGVGNLTSNDYASFTYDEKNRLKTVTKDGQTLRYNYDDLHRITSTEYDSHVVGYAYDDNSNVRQITYPDGKQVTYTYDEKDRMTIVEDWSNHLTSYTYLDDDRLSTITYPNGIITSYFYDGAGRMTGQTTMSGPDTLLSYIYALDANGNHIQENKKEPFGLPTLEEMELTHTYNSRNEITDTGYDFDPNGNVTSQPNRAYAKWDAHDMLEEISGDMSAVYTYDGLGHRRSSVINGRGKKYILDILGMSQVLMDTDLNDNPENYYVYGLGLISAQKSDGSTYIYHGDFRGSVVAVTDNSSEITNSYQYDEFGILINESEQIENIFKYVGLHGVQHDDDGLYFMRARYYDPNTGRFISEDPIWGDNLYSYSLNDPVNHIDPDGELPHWVAGAVIGAVVGGVTQIAANALRGDKWIDAEVGKEMLKGAVIGGVTSATFGVSAIGIKGVSSIGANSMRRIAGNAVFTGLSEGAYSKYYKQNSTEQAVLDGVVNGFTSFAGDVFGGELIRQYDLTNNPALNRLMNSTPFTNTRIANYSGLLDMRFNDTKMLKDALGNTASSLVGNGILLNYNISEYAK